jgi:DNA-binding NarL/FixJ family response regulator
MSITLTQAQQEIYSQACALRATRQRAHIMLAVENEFTRAQFLHHFPAHIDVSVLQGKGDLFQSYLTIAPDMLILDPSADRQGAIGDIYQLDSMSFVVLLADGMEQRDIFQSLEEGAQGFLTKPYTERKIFHYLKLISGGAYATPSLVEKDQE